MVLYKHTGIGIVSIGENRILKFRNIKNPDKKKDFTLPLGSFIYMTQNVQTEWQHAIPKTTTDNGRISLTFRKIK